MKKILITLTLITQLLFSASLEQVESYLSLSNALEEVIEMESQFASMQSSFTQETNSSYDMQMLSIRFKDYIEKNLSEDEMNEILGHYRNVLFLQYSSAMSTLSSEGNETMQYIKSLEDEEDGKLRIELVDKLSQIFYNSESVAIMFDNLMKPFIESSKGAKDLDEDNMKKRRKDYIDFLLDSMRENTLFATKDFMIEELEELLAFCDKPSVDREVKVMIGATAYALKEFFLSMASRYDVSKH